MTCKLATYQEHSLLRAVLRYTVDTFENDIEVQVAAVLKYEPIPDKKMEEIRVVTLDEPYDGNPKNVHHRQMASKSQAMHRNFTIL